MASSSSSGSEYGDESSSTNNGSSTREGKRSSARIKSQQKTQQENNNKPSTSLIDGNQDYCEICSQCGELVLCDTCPRAYHLVCMDTDSKELPEGQWSCPHCEEYGIEEREEAKEPVEETKEPKPEKILCKVCKGSGSDIIFCATCPARYHPACLSPPLDTVPEGWQCAPCSVEPLKAKVHRIITWRWKQTEVKESPLKSKKKREREFFVKWKDLSYWHCSWILELQLIVFHNTMYRSFCNKNDMNIPPPLDDGSGDFIVGKESAEEGVTAATGAVSMKERRQMRKSRGNIDLDEKYYRYGIRPEWLQVHRVINHRKHKGKYSYLVKWRELPYEEVTLEVEPESHEFDITDYKKAVDDYWALKERVQEEAQAEKYESEKSSKKSKKKDREKSRKAKSLSDPKKKWDKQPSFIPEPLQLHPYQLEGVNWLRYSWVTKTDTILADEMGLGKTIQTIVFLYSLYKEGHTRGPFLITAPLSTIINWERELEDWSPDFYVVNYTGQRDSRMVIRENEFSYDSMAVRGGAKASRLKKKATVKFNVLLTSYELINIDSALLASIDWKILVVDEAHRLKSNQSLFFRTLNNYNVNYKLLLTGTPLQNNLEELFNLLNFLSPDRFNDMDGFLNEFAEIAKEEQVKKLHDMLGPHLLRRLKADVLTGMPSKSEFIVRVELTPLQKKYYKYILTKNFEALNIRGGGRQCSLLNIVMDLKKCSNHPYLFTTAAQEAPKTKNGYFEGQALVKASGKLVVLQKMLKKLKEEGHRVLIFSQMTMMLDLLEDFCEAEGYKYERIDGAITGSLRQDAIDRFNAPNAQQFIFLLSTRAGGLGINLATADTVIIYDSDWNPHNDIQALSRAHRIGQSNKVMIYRFVTRNSVEERITQVAKKKMMLTHLVVRPGLGSKGANQASMTKQELDDILKFGTEELFKEEEGKDSAIHYDDKAIGELLDRSKEGIEQKEMWANEYLSSFKVASYVTKEAEEVEEEQPKEESTDPQYWEKLLGAHFIQLQENIGRTLGKGKRIRKQVNYSGQDDFNQANESDSSSDYSGFSDLSSNDEDFDLKDDGGAGGGRSKLRRSAKEKMPPLLAVIGGNTEVLGFTAKHRKAFLDVVLRFGLPSQEINITDSQWYVRELKGKSEKHLRAYASLFVSHLANPGDPNSKTFDDNIPKEGLNVNFVLARIGIISLIRKKVHEYEGKHGVRSITVNDHTQNIIDDDEMKEENQSKINSENQSINDEEQSQSSISIDQINNSVQSTDNKTIDGTTENSIDETPNEESKGEKMDVDQDKNNKGEDKNIADENQIKEKTQDKDENGVDAEQNESKNGQNVAKDDVEMKDDEEKEKDVTEKVEEIKLDDTKEVIELDDEKVKEEKDEDEKENRDIKVEKFDFIIRDGGLTELHILWYFEDLELKPGKEHEIWNRRHDYWLLAGIVKHGYQRWKEIHEDDDLKILNEPFKNSLNIKNKFMERRLRLLEQALVMEEQLRRTNHLNKLIEKENIQDESDKKEEEMKDGDENGENKLDSRIQRVVNQVENLLTDMKSDCGRIPHTLQRIPPIAQRLQLSQKGYNEMATSKVVHIP